MTPTTDQNAHKLVRDVLLNTIDHNAETKPNPHHHNSDLMTSVLKLEQKIIGNGKIRTGLTCFMLGVYIGCAPHTWGWL